VLCSASYSNSSALVVSECGLNLIKPPQLSAAKKKNGGVFIIAHAFALFSFKMVYCYFIGRLPPHTEKHPYIQSYKF
jgi:hypothetical protein